MKIILSKKVSEKIIKKLRSAGNRETKGALFARRMDAGNFEIEDVFICKSFGSTVFSNLVINYSYKRFERKYFKRFNYDFENHNYIGDWHSHPLFNCVPSDYDKRELKEEFQNSNAIFLIQLIVKIVDDKLVGRCYYITNATKISECEIEIL